MADRLAGKVAIVTGAGSRAAGIGNGRAAAILFAREGARVLVVDRSRAAAEATLKMILGGGGAIVNISSISALRPRGLTPYSASKGAVIALTRAMAIDHAQQGIRVNCVAPGPVYTPMVYADGMSEELRERRRCASPLGIEGTGWDVGYAALFLVSDEARYITGVVLPVDGGVTIASPSR